MGIKKREDFLLPFCVSYQAYVLKMRELAKGGRGRYNPSPRISFPLLSGLLCVVLDGLSMLFTIVTWLLAIKEPLN